MGNWYGLGIIYGAGITIASIFGGFLHPNGNEILAGAFLLVAFPVWCYSQYKEFKHGGYKFISE